MFYFIGMKKQRRGNNPDKTEREDNYNVSLHHYITKVRRRFPVLLYRLFVPRLPLSSLSIYPAQRKSHDWSGKSHDYCDVIVLKKKFHFQNVFRPHGNGKPVFSNFPGLKSVYEKLRFRNGLMRTVGLTVERNKPPLSNSSSVVWMPGLVSKTSVKYACLIGGYFTFSYPMTSYKLPKGYSLI